MADILFSHSYFLKRDPKQFKLGQPYPPLGTLYAASLAREEGYSVALHDVFFSETPDEIIAAIEKEKPFALVIYDDGFNYLTKMCLTNMRDAAFRMAEIASEKNIKVIICSSDSTDHYEKYLSHGADFVVLGEGEVTVLEIIEELKSGKTDFENIQGIAFRKNEETMVTGKSPVMKDLDSFPLPAWDLVDIRPYKKMWAQHGYFSINMATTRGCPYKCNWCAKPIWGQRYHTHSPKRVVEEMVYLKKNFGMDHIWFCDDIFGLKPGWIREFADELKNANIKIPFKIQSRADLLIKGNTIAELAEAGCEMVWLGAESGSQKILDAMDKGTSIEQIYSARKLLKEHGIKSAFFLQFGYPGETKEDIEATLKMLKELMPDDIGISVSYPLPGTKFYEMVKDELKDKTNWTDSDDLALMFRNFHSPAFYKRLHRYVHKKFRKWQAMESMGKIFRKPFKSKKEEYRKGLTFAWYLPASMVESMKLNWNTNSEK